jgi:hypothetical protein
VGLLGPIGAGSSAGSRTHPIIMVGIRNSMIANLIKSSTISWLVGRALLTPSDPAQIKVLIELDGSNYLRVLRLLVFKNTQPCFHPIVRPTPTP